MLAMLAMLVLAMLKSCCLRDAYAAPPSCLFHTGMQCYNAYMEAHIRQMRCSRSRHRLGCIDDPPPSLDTCLASARATTGRRRANSCMAIRPTRRVVALGREERGSIATKGLS